LEEIRIIKKNLDRFKDWEDNRYNYTSEFKSRILD
tara:strand:+ start:2734 stop:2838 length:105 start_codon:yes stop_codon:yes gene_type:complete